MKPLDASQIRGNWATLLLPVNADDSIDEGLLEAEIDYYIAAKVNGIYSNGSAGEFYTQTPAEYERVNTILAQKCEKAGMPFQIGASHMSPQLSLERMRFARGLCPSAMQIILPDWFPPTMPEILAFLRKIAEEAGDIPLVVYNPPHAKKRLDPADWRTIAEAVPQVQGVKVPGGDDAWYAQMRPLFDRLSVFVPGHLLASGIAKGAHGAYSNVACLSPRGAQAWYEQCLGYLPKAIAFEQRLLAFWRGQIEPLITIHHRSNMAADKTAAVAGGWLPGMTPRMRWPYVGTPVDECGPIAQAARAMLPEFF